MMPWDLQRQPFTWPSLPGNSTQATLAGMGSPSLQPTGDGAGAGKMSPQDMAKLRLMMQFLNTRGTGGMQPSSAAFSGPQGPTNFANALQGGGQQNSLMAMIMQNPQLLQWFMQQQQGGSGSFPQGGGGVTLAQLLGAPQQAGQPT